MFNQFDFIILNGQLVEFEWKEKTHENKKVFLAGTLPLEKLWTSNGKSRNKSANSRHHCFQIAT